MYQLEFKPTQGFEALDTESLKAPIAGYFFIWLISTKTVVMVLFFLNSNYQFT